MREKQEPAVDPEADETLKPFLEAEDP